MPDQMGEWCPEHDPRGLHCFCDEKRDLDAGVHRHGSMDNGLGGYLCICGGLMVFDTCLGTDEETVQSVDESP